MEEFDYEKVIELKRKGNFNQCESLYHTFMNENENNDSVLNAKFYEGYSKIKILQQDYAGARITLAGVIRDVLIQRSKLMDKVNINQDSLTAEETILLSTILYSATRELEFLLSTLPDFDKLLDDMRVNRFEFIVLLSSDLRDTLFKYFFCRVCSNTIDKTQYNLAQRQDMITKNKTSIEKVFQGIASSEDTENYEEVFNELMGNKKNKWMIILAILPEIMAILK